jgi:hypothetical protein
MRVVLTVLLLTVLSGAQADTHVWHVRFGAEGETPLSVSSNAGLIEFRNDKAVVFTIPAAAITTIFHARQQIRRSTQAFDLFEGICCGGTDSHLLSALAFLVASPLGSSTSEYVEIGWTSKGPGNVQLRLAPDEYIPFMNWLSDLSGIRWRDLEQERRDAIQKIEQRAGDAFPVSDQSPNVAEYHVLPIESGGDTLLYLFRGSVTPKNLISIFPVTEEAADNTCVPEHWGRIMRGTCRNDRCQIRAILTPKYTYRPGTLPRTYTVGADGLSRSECPASEAQWQRRESEPSEMPQTLHRTVRH